MSRLYFKTCLGIVHPSRQRVYGRLAGVVAHNQLAVRGGLEHNSPIGLLDSNTFGTNFNSAILVLNLESLAHNQRTDNGLRDKTIRRNGVAILVGIVNLTERRLCGLPVIICKNQQVVDKTNLFVLKFIRCFRYLLTTEDAVLVNRKLLIDHICERRSQCHIERVANKRGNGFTLFGVGKNILPVRTYLARSGRRIRDEVCICITPVIKAHSISKCHREFFAVIKIDSNFQKCGVIPQAFLFLNCDNLAKLKQSHLLSELILLSRINRFKRE